MAEIKKWDDYYDERGYFLKYPDENLIRFIMRELKLSNPKTALDLGSGIGRNSFFMGTEGLEVLGIDVSSKAIALANNKAKDLMDQGLVKNVTFKRMDLLEIDKLSQKFDIIIDIQSIQCNKFLAVKEIIDKSYDLLNDGGKFFGYVVSVDDQAYNKGTEIEMNTFTNITEGTFTGVGMIHFFTKEEIEKLFSRFKHISIERSSRTINDMSEKVDYFIVVGEK